MKPTIGIIGGCGPLATVDIEHKILKVTQNLHPMVDQDYFNLLVFNYTQFSDRNDAISSGQKELFNDYLRCANSLVGVGIDLLLIACQTAHVYLPELKSKLNVPIVDIVQETVCYINNIVPTNKKIGLLSTEVTQKRKLYQTALEPFGIEVVIVTPDIQKRLMEAIYIIKTGVNFIGLETELPNIALSKLKSDKHTELGLHPYRRVLLNKSLPNPIYSIQEAIDYLIMNGCEHVILGCTELPLALPYLNTSNVNIIDPNFIVAKSAVDLAHKLEQEKLKQVV